MGKTGIKVDTPRCQGNKKTGEKCAAVATYCDPGDPTYLRKWCYWHAPHLEEYRSIRKNQPYQRKLFNG